MQINPPDKIKLLKLYEILLQETDVDHPLIRDHKKEAFFYLYTIESVLSLYGQITRSLIQKGLQISTMESCTSGMIASLITDTEGSSAVMKGSAITYSNEAKIACGVPENTITKFGVYSKETAASMASAARQTYKADIGIGVTGSFGNTDPANTDSVPGEVYFAIATEKENRTFFRQLPPLDSRHAYKLCTAELVGKELFAAIW